MVPKRTERLSPTTAKCPLEVKDPRCDDVIAGRTCQKTVGGWMVDDLQQKTEILWN